MFYGYIKDVQLVICRSTRLRVWDLAVYSLKSHVFTDLGAYDHRPRNSGHWGTCPQDFAINKEVPFLFLESAPFFLRKKCQLSVVPLQV